MNGDARGKESLRVDIEWERMEEDGADEEGTGGAACDLSLSSIFSMYSLAGQYPMQSAVAGWCCCSLDCLRGLDT